MKKPFFSVIIPTFNDADFLKKALQSCYNQTYKNFEVIVIDNHSTDHTSKIISLYKKVRYTKIKNYGVIAKSRNLGIQLSKGRWLAFLDADDYWDKAKLFNVHSLIKKKTKVDLICHSEWIKNLKNNKKKLWCYGPSTNHFYKDLLLLGNRLSTSASIVKKEFIKKKNIFFDENKNFVTVEDYCFFLTIAKNNGSFFFLDKPLGYHLYHDKSASSNRLKHFKSFKSVIKHHVYKIQSFSNKKNILYNNISAIISIKKKTLEIKNGKLNLKKINRLVKSLKKKPFITLKYYKYIFFKFLKQSFLTYVYK